MSAHTERLDRMHTACALAFVGSFLLPVALRPSPRILGYEVAVAILLESGDRREIIACLGFNVVAVALMVPSLWTRWFCRTLAVVLVGASLGVLPLAIQHVNRAFGVVVWLGSMVGLGISSFVATLRTDVGLASSWPFRFATVDLMVIAGCFAALAFWSNA